MVALSTSRKGHAASLSGLQINDQVRRCAPFQGLSYLSRIALTADLSLSCDCKHNSGRSSAEFHSSL